MNEMEIATPQEDALLSAANFGTSHDVLDLDVDSEFSCDNGEFTLYETGRTVGFSYQPFQGRSYE